MHGQQNIKISHAAISCFLSRNILLSTISQSTNSSMKYQVSNPYIVRAEATFTVILTFRGLCNSETSLIKFNWKQ